MARARGSGPRIALPAFTCFDVATAAVGAGAELLCYDIDPETLAPDPSSLERALREGAGVAVIAPLFGLPVGWHEIQEIARRHGAVLVEDAAQGFGAQEVGRPLGSLGDLGVLSFGRGKGWTGGSGGALLMNRREESVLGSLAAPRSGGGVLLKSAAQWLLGRPSLYGIPARIPFLALGETHYRAPTAPRAMTPVAAALALKTHEAALAEVSHRRANARRMLGQLLESPPEVAHPVGRHAEPGASFLRLPLLVGPRGARLRASPRARSRGVLPSYPMPLPSLPAVATRLALVLQTPGAATLSTGLITLPTHSLADTRIVLQDLMD
jgi:dTDP-4-amino-4,6-dideoxygalactose transaminase